MATKQVTSHQNTPSHYPKNPEAFSPCTDNKTRSPNAERHDAESQKVESQNTKDDENTRNPAITEEKLENLDSQIAEELHFPIPSEQILLQSKKSPEPPSSSSLNHSQEQDGFSMKRKISQFKDKAVAFVTEGWLIPSYGTLEIRGSFRPSYLCS